MIFFSAFAETTKDAFLIRQGGEDNKFCLAFKFAAGKIANALLICNEHKMKKNSTSRSESLLDMIR
jgi:hypothetical protein